MSDLVHVKGLSELQAFLDQLPAKLEKNIMRGAMRAGMSTVKPVAQANIESVSGQLSSGLKISTNSKGGKITARLIAKGQHDYIARFVEFGTAPHLIKISDADRPTRNTRHGVRKFSMRTINKMIGRGSLVINGNFVGPVVSHPGAQPRPFLRPALDQQAQAAVIAAGNYIKKRLTKDGLNTADVLVEAGQ